MSSDTPANPLTESGVTIPSDSEQYSGNDDTSPSPLSSLSSPPIILYTPPTLWGVLRGAAINLLLPFINGLMLGFGELFAHEAAFRLGWGGTKVWISSTSTYTGSGIGIIDWKRFEAVLCLSTPSLYCLEALATLLRYVAAVWANTTSSRSSQVIEVRTL